MIGWFENDSNNVMSGISYVFLMSAVSSRCTGMYFEEFNLRRVISLYAVRRIFAVHTWDIHDDVYACPEDEEK